MKGATVMLIRILSLVLFLAATYAIAQANYSIELIGLVVALELRDWPK